MTNTIYIYNQENDNFIDEIFINGKVNREIIIKELSQYYDMNKIYWSII